MSNTITDIYRADYHAESLKQIITGLNNSINTLRKRYEEVSGYDGLWLLEDSKPIFGMAFIAFQNYINTSINELFEGMENKTSYYKIGSKSKSYDKSNIELIIGLANYFKHKDEERLHAGTQNILDAFNLKPSSRIEESPIFEGLAILDEKWDLFKLYEIVINWRKELYNHYYRKTYLKNSSSVDD